MITTSYFAMARYLPKAVSISNIKPAWYTGGEIRMLVPPFYLVDSYKAGYITDATFTKDYTENVLSILNAQDVYDYIVTKFGEDATLVCYEKIGDFCHRHIVAKWLERGTGKKIPELIVTDEMKKQFKIAKKAMAKDDCKTC